MATSPRRPARHLLALACAVVLFGGCSDSAPSPTRLEPGTDLDEVASEPVRGVYVHAVAAGSRVHLGSLLRLAESSEVNSFVVDVKEEGEVSYDSSVPLASAIGADRDYISDLPALIRTLDGAGIHAIARIVVFRDPVLARARPEWAIRTRSGDIWVEPASGRAWVDPYNRDVWAYNIELAREALTAGFDEIQWDYVRFPDVPERARRGMVFPAADGDSRAEAIAGFITMSRRELADFDAPITADVFGRVITSRGGSGIGQDWDLLTPAADVLLPMVYPSLYPPGELGVADPPGQPYRIVRVALDRAVARLQETDRAVATLRPWLQAFSQGGRAYGPDQIRDQIQAVEDAGLREWLFWNPTSVYPAGVF